jgi:hypothetical protein
MTISADAMNFLIQQRILCGSVGITPCLSADLTGDLLVVAFPPQVAFCHCVTLLVVALCWVPWPWILVDCCLDTFHNYPFFPFSA